MLMNRLRYIGMMLLFAVVTCTMLGSFSDRCEAYVLQEMQCPLDHDMEVTAPWGEDNHGSPPHVHKGIDFAATQGEPVRAVADGYITSAGWDDTAMYMVTIQHADGWRSVYMDMGGLAVSGGPVSKGDIIGYVGGAYTAPDGTVISSGPHLHFEIRVDPNNESLCPWAFIVYAPWLPPNCVDGAYMEATKAIWSATYDFTGPVKKVIDQITSACAKAIDLLKGIIGYTLAILMTIDLAVSMMLSTVDSSKGSAPGTPIFSMLIFKCLIYLFLFFLVTNWSAFIGNSMRTFFVNSGAVMAGSSYDIASKLVADPFSMVTRGAKIITPLFEVINNYVGDSSLLFDGIKFMLNFAQVVPAIIFALIIFSCFALFAIEIVLSMLEFYLMIVFSFPAFMFAGYKKTRQYAEYCISGIFASSIKLMFFVFFATLLQSVTSSLVVQDLVDKEAESVVWKAVAHSDGNFQSVEELEAAIVMVETGGSPEAYVTPSSDGYGWGAWQISYDEWVSDYTDAYHHPPQSPDPDNNPDDLPYDMNSPVWAIYNIESTPHSYRAQPYNSDWHDVTDENGNCIYTASNPWPPEVQDQVAKTKIEKSWKRWNGDAREVCKDWNGRLNPNYPGNVRIMNAYWEKVKAAHGEIKRKAPKILIGPLAELTLICLFFVILADHLSKAIMAHFGGSPGSGFRFINE